jgi:hypothetical protein
MFAIARFHLCRQAFDKLVQEGYGINLASFRLLLEESEPPRQIRQVENGGFAQRSKCSYGNAQLRIIVDLTFSTAPATAGTSSRSVIVTRRSR